LIALVHNLDRAFASHMVRAAHARGQTELRSAHNYLFGTLGDEGARSVDLAARAGITRQSMGEVIRDLVDLGILEMAPDPQDGRAKIVRYTPEGKRFASAGYVHLRDLEEVFEQEFGADYEAARSVLERVVDLISEPSSDVGQG
jgi:DNA-binding MarR family transcriptional regulator